LAIDTLWPQGFADTLDVPSAIIAIGAAIALFKYKRNVMHVIGLCGIAWRPHQTVTIGNISKATVNSEFQL
jgi:hypothetical protein